MWKEYPTKNEEILPCVCFSAPSQQGFRRPLVLSKDTDERVGVYKYALVYENEITEGKCLSDDIRRLTETFVNGVRAINDNTRSITSENLEKANIRYLMSYIKSEAYKQLLQDKDNRGKEKAEDYLKNVLELFFSLIPDSIIEKFDKGLEAHDEIRERLESIPEDDIDTREAVLKSQGYFKTIDDYNLFVVLRKYILTVKNNYNPLKADADREDFKEYCKNILMTYAAESAKYFERLPILENADILRNIVYAGIWSRFNSLNTDNIEE
jgi:hypothetical protein